MAQHGPPAHGMENLVKAGFHAGALASGKDNGG
jgi:hypothetical protein